MHRRFVSVALTAAAFAAVTLVDVRADESKAGDAIARLKTGNARFVSNPEDTTWLDVQKRNALAKGQTPFATILSCADSRVAPEIVFRAGLGELFVVRAAGNVTDKAILASVEYAVEHLHTPLVMVMGHESCGAVKAAAETPASTSLGPNLDYLLKAIRPSVTATRTRPETERLRAAILENVEETLNDMVVESTILRDAARAGHVGFVGAYYEMSTGKVHFSEPVHMMGTETHAKRPTNSHAKGVRH